MRSQNRSGKRRSTPKTSSKTWRAAKSAFELERLRRAAEIADAGVSALHEDARPGLKEYELAAIVEHRMRSLGAEDNFGMVVANSHNQALHPPTDRVVQPGDIIIGEITPCIGGLFVQICRTMVLGEPPPVVREKYAILQKGDGSGYGRGANRRAGERCRRGDQRHVYRIRLRSNIAGRRSCACAAMASVAARSRRAAWKTATRPNSKRA